MPGLSSMEVSARRSIKIEDQNRKKVEQLVDQTSWNGDY